MKSKRVLAWVMAIAFAGASTLALADNEVNQRMENQHDRIQQGVQSGQLTKKEAHKLHKQEKRIHRQVKKERKENGGNLTNKEKKQVNKEMNKESKRIYRKKHNDKVRPDAK